MTKYVRCIDNSGESDALTLNKIYKIISQYGYYYWIINDNGKENNYYQNLFEEVDESEVEEMKGENMKKHVKCINILNKPDELTLGKVYEFIEEVDGFYCIINDDGVQCSYYKNRFEKVNEKSSDESKPVYKFVPNSELIPAIVNGVDGVLIKQ